MTVEDLRQVIEEPFYEDERPEDEIVRTCFLTINRNTGGSWSCGYVTWDDEGHEMAIPQLVINDANDLDEVALRMDLKLKRWDKLHG